MMTEDEIKSFMKMLVARDKRTVGHADVSFWLAMSEVGGWSYRQAVRAFIEHASSRPGEWFEPGHVTQRVDEVRAELKQRWYCPDPPRELGGDPRAEIEWRRNAAEEFMRVGLEGWAAGRPLPEPQVALESGGSGVIRLFPGDSDAKRAAVESVQRFARKHAVERPKRRPRRAS